ncbi:MAG: hypothetical protein IJW33_05460 [Lentisphaeria bacterium]|nr:hypothetical protein [Lentisphaeria bacterium]
MIFGMICGFAAAIINSAGYLFNARFLQRYPSPLRLLAVATFLIMLIALPLMLVFFPFGVLPCWWKYVLQTVLASALFLAGQGCFFGAMRYFEASRISSLLGLKIVVLSVLFIAAGGTLNWKQLTAVLAAAIAGMIFNRAGTQRVSWRGWVLLMMTLIFYSSVDMVETDLVVKMRQYSNFSTFRSSFAVVTMIYTVLGMLMLPVLFRLKTDKEQLKEGLPYAILWLLSQVLLFACFANLKPVFGNVILATRGIFSVAAGLLLPYMGLAALDSKIPMSLWMRRIAAALLMIGAIALYSFGSL